MKAHLMAVLYVVIGALVALMVYNMFISGSSWFGHFESSNSYDVTDDGTIIDIRTGLPVAA